MHYEVLNDVIGSSLPQLTRLLLEVMIVSEVYCQYSHRLK